LTNRIAAMVRRIAPGALLWIVGLGFGAVTLRNWIQLNDEGLMLQAAARISEGQVPYRDFWWFYPPGQSYLLALIWKLTGPSLIPWRLVRAASDATVALLVWRLALRRGGRFPALAAWLASILAVSSATGPHPYPIAMAFALSALLLLERRPALAGAFAGAAAVWRIEFAAYLALGCAIGLAVRGGALRPFVRFAAGGFAVAAAAYVPMVVAAGAARSWELLVRYPVLEFGKYQTLPFPLVWDGGGNARGLDLLAQVLSYHGPLALVLTLLASGLALLALRRDGGWLELATFVFGFGMANYLVVRADAFHTGPLAIIDSVLVAWAVSALLEARRKRGVALAPMGSGRKVVAVGATFVCAAGLCWGIADTAWKRIREVDQARAAVEIPLSVADGVREMPVTRCSLRGAPIQLCRTSDLVATVKWVDSHVAPDQSIYVTTSRSDLVTAGAPLFYILAGRSNATKYDIAAPGVVTSAAVQAEIIRDIASRRAVVVRDGAGITAAPEPNLAGKSSGVRILDQWLARNYVEAARFGVWSVLEPRSGARDRGAADAR